MTEQQHMIASILYTLDTFIRPLLQLHGGDITFVAYDKGTVYLQLEGACITCSASKNTIEAIVVESLKQELPLIVHHIVIAGSQVRMSD